MWPMNTRNAGVEIGAWDWTEPAPVVTAAATGGWELEIGSTGGEEDAIVTEF